MSNENSMNRHRPRRRGGRGRRPNNRPLAVSLADRVAATMPQIALRQSAPEPMTKPLPPLPSPPPRPARDVLSLLLAATGFALAGRADAHVELLPGTPTMVAIKTRGLPAAIFTLPALTLTEACRIFGQPAPTQRDRVLERVLDEDRESALADPEILLDQRRAWVSGEEDDHGLC